MLDENPKYSIIIPLYNRQDIVQETLLSVQKQTFEHWECIIIDDGSTDESLLVAQNQTKEDVRFQVIERPLDLPKGANACRNFGYSLSQGSYILWFDSDDIMKSNYLEEIEVRVKEYPRTQLITCSHQVFTNVIPEETDQVVSPPLLNAKDFILRRQFLQTGAAIWKRDFLETIKLKEFVFDERLSQSQDYDFFARALLCNPIIIQIAKVLYYFRRNNASISTQFMKGNMAHLESFLKVKEKLSQAQKEDCEVVIGLLNHVLGSFRNSIVIKNPAFFNAHLDYLRSWNNDFDYVSNSHILGIIRLAKILRVFKKGTLYFKDSFFIEVGRCEK